MTRDPLRDPDSLIPRVYAYVAYRVGDGPDAEDITSEVFERALRYRETYDPRKGEPLAWLIGIARYRIIERASSRTAELSGESFDAPDPRSLEDGAIRRITISQALGLLDEHDRELIALRYGADLTARQIASVLGTRTNNVEVALHRALARLRAELEQDAPGNETASPS